MLSEQGSMTFLLRVLDYLAVLVKAGLNGGLPEGVTPRIPLDVLGYISAGAEMGIMIWWINNNMPYSPEEMARMLYNIHANGLWWGLGVDKEISLQK
jgi:hypothetical protein